MGGLRASLPETGQQRQLCAGGGQLRPQHEAMRRWRRPNLELCGELRVARYRDRAQPAYFHQAVHQLRRANAIGQAIERAHNIERARGCIHLQQRRNELAAPCTAHWSSPGQRASSCCTTPCGRVAQARR